MNAGFPATDHGLRATWAAQHSAGRIRVAEGCAGGLAPYALGALALRFRWYGCFKPSVSVLQLGFLTCRAM